MNETFSINRYYTLLRKELSERAPIIIKIAVIFSLLLAGYWLSVILFNGSPSSVSSRSTYILFVTLITMVIAPFNLYKSYNHNKKGIDYVMLPASVLEKFLSMQTISVICLPLVTFVAVLLSDVILTTISPSVFSGYAITGLWDYEKPFENILEALIFQQGCILGNFLFRKNKIFKTLLSAVGLYIVLALILMFFLTVVFKDQFHTLQSMNMNIKINNISELSQLGANGDITSLLKGLYYISVVFYYFIFPVGFLAGSFYKMKTQQY